MTIANRLVKIMSHERMSNKGCVMTVDQEIPGFFNVASVSGQKYPYSI